tara:strand:+ start:383 stop:799 length:417 start_codon:yes stop_codon:yes gene_type:complete
MNEKILAFRREEQRSKAIWDNKQREQELKYKDKKKAFNYFKNKHLTEAKLTDYEGWLKLWLVDNNITHYYDYNMPLSNYVATSNFILDTGFCGAVSFNIIVPKGIKYEIKEIGHCNIYDMNNVKCIGGWIPAYKDINV